MTSDQFVMSQAALLCWRAAPHKSLDQMRALAFLLRNRVAAGWNGGEWLEVVRDYSKHAACDPDDTYPDLRGAGWRKFAAEFDTIYNSMAPDKMTEGALYCCDPGEVKNSWFMDNIIGHAATHAHVATVSPLMFFK